MLDFLIVAGLLTTTLGLSYYVLRDSMNVFQWFPWWGTSRRRLYWMSRNTTPINIPMLSKGFLVLNMAKAYDGTPQYFKGNGIQIRFLHWSFQIGFGTLEQESPWHRELDVPVEEIKKGTLGVWEEQDITVS